MADLSAVVAAVRPVIYREAAEHLRVAADGMPTDGAAAMLWTAATLEAADRLELVAEQYDGDLAMDREEPTA